MIKGIIYRATNKTNNKCYVGKSKHTLDDRITNHYKHTKEKDKNGKWARRYKFMNALRKYKKTDWKWEILYDNVPKINLNLLEIWNIAVYDSYENGYNSTTGGDCGYEHSAETKRKMSEAHKGIKLSEEHRKKIGLAQKGRKHTKESKKKMSEATSGENNINAKLTWKEVREIRAKYIPWKYSCSKLAKEYGVDITTIHRIIINKIWKES